MASMVDSEAYPSTNHTFITLKEVSSSDGIVPPAAPKKTYLDRANAVLPTIKGVPLLLDIIPNLKAAVTVALVSLPLSVALAVAAGGHPNQGVASAVFGGLVGGIFCSCHYNVEGPTGALSGILLSNSQSLSQGDKEAQQDILAFLAILAGALSLIAVFLGLDKYLVFLPAPVVQGFTLGVALIIGLNQVTNIFYNYSPTSITSAACALPTPPPLEVPTTMQSAAALWSSVEDPISDHDPIPYNESKCWEVSETFYINVSNSFSHMSNVDVYSVLVFLFFFIPLFLLVKRFKNVPWTMVVAPVGCLLGYLSEEQNVGPLILNLGSRYTNIDRNIVFPVSFPPSTLTAYDTSAVLFAAFSISLVSLLETLISARIADGMTNTTSRPRKEGFANSLSNFVTGAAGGVPVTAALARTALGIRSGARSRTAVILNSIIVGLIAIALMPYFKYLPLPVVGAIVVNVCVVIALVCLATDPTMGIIVGTVISLLRFANDTSLGHAEMMRGMTSTRRPQAKVDLYALDNTVTYDFVPDGCLWTPRLWEVVFTDLGRQVLSVFDKAKYESEAKERENSVTGRRNHALLTPFSPGVGAESGLTFHHVALYRVIGKMTFINSRRHVGRMQLICGDATVTTVILSCRFMHYIDMDGVEAIGEICTMVEECQKTVLITGLNEQTIGMIMLGDWYHNRLERGHILPSYEDAIKYLVKNGALAIANVNEVYGERNTYEEGKPHQRRGMAIAEGLHASPVATAPDLECEEETLGTPRDGDSVSPPFAAQSSNVEMGWGMARPAQD